jgi:hypothetical protein
LAKPGDGLQSDGPLAAAAEFDQRLRALVHSLGGFVLDSPLEGSGFEPSVPLADGGSSREGLSVRVKAASDPGWPIVFDPGLGSLYASKPIKLLLRAFRPYHNDETPAALRWKNFEGRLIFDCRHFTTSPIIRRTEGRAPIPIQIGARTSLAPPGTRCDRGPETQREPQFRYATGWLRAANRSGLLAV